ncbi:MAG: hypothetical protein HN590_12865, partial [Calditrichaeota bacterium]|nr:hypothetical protein [Calditrichota bacterium]
MDKNTQLDVSMDSVIKIDISKTFEWNINISQSTEGSTALPEIVIPTEFHKPMMVNIHELPQLVSILGIDEGLKQLVEIFNSHEHCLYVVNASEISNDILAYLLGVDRVKNILLMNDRNGSKSVKYVRSLGEYGYQSILQVQLNEINAGFEYLTNANWVLLTGDLKGSKAGELPFVQFLFECADRKIPVWSMQQIGITDLIKHSSITNAQAEKLPNNVLGYDILSCTDFELIDSRVKIIEGVADIQERLLLSQVAITTSTMALAYRMHQLVLLSHERGKRPFWRANFGVNSFTEYCEVVLGISQNLGSQYLTSIRTVELLKPGILAETFDTKKSVLALPGHTRFRDVGKLSKQIISLKETDKEGFEECIDYIFDVNHSNSDVKYHISNMLKIKPRKLKASTNTYSSIILLIKRIRSFGASLKKDLKSEKYSDLDELINKIVELIDVQSVLPSEDSKLKLGDVKIDEDSSENENISRETFPDEVEVDAPDSIVEEEEVIDEDKPVDFYVQEKVDEKKWEEVTLAPEVTGLKRPMDIFVAPRTSSFIKTAWHGDKDTFCPPIWADIALGSGACGFGCRTCFLMLTFRSMRDPSRPLIYTNYEKMDSDIQKWLMAKHYSYIDPVKAKEKKDEKDPERKKLIKTKIVRNRSYKETIGLGIDCADSLLFEGYTQHLRRIAPIFQSEKTNPLGTELVLLTKSANTHFLDELDSSKNIIVTMSLNPEGIADLWEGKYLDGVRITPPITERLVALKHAQDLGFEVRVRLDPILTPDGWEEQYRDFTDEMFSLGIKPSFITLGTYREKNHQIDTWREKWGLLPAEIDKFDVGDEKEGTHFHIQNRSEIYSTVESIITKGYAGGSF